MPAVESRRIFQVADQADPTEWTKETQLAHNQSVSESGKKPGFLPPLKTLMFAFPYVFALQKDRYWTDDPIRDKPWKERLSIRVQRVKSAMSAHGYARIQTRNHSSFILRAVTEGRFATTSFLVDAMGSSNELRLVVVPIAAALAALLLLAVPSLTTFVAVAAFLAGTSSIGMVAAINLANRYRGVSRPLRDFERAVIKSSGGRVWRARTLGTPLLEQLSSTLEALVESADRTLLPVHLTYVCRGEEEASFLETRFGFSRIPVSHGNLPIVFRGCQGDNSSLDGWETHVDRHLAPQVIVEPSGSDPSAIPDRQYQRDSTSSERVGDGKRTDGRADLVTRTEPSTVEL